MKESHTMKNIIDVYIQHAVSKSTPREISQGDNDKSHPIIVCGASFNWYADGKLYNKDYTCPSSKVKNSKIIRTYLTTIRELAKTNPDAFFVVHVSEYARRFNLHEKLYEIASINYVSENDMDSISDYLYNRSVIQAKKLMNDGVSYNDTIFENDKNTTYNLVKKMMPKYHVATDGSVFCNKNTQVSSSACISEDGQMHREVLNNNNIHYAELRAVWLAVNKFAKPGRNLVIHSDSALTINKIARFKEGVKTDDPSYNMVKSIHDKMNDGCYITFKKVKGHDNHIMNTAADAVAGIMLMKYKKNNRVSTTGHCNNLTHNAIQNMLKDLHGKDYCKNKIISVKEKSACVVERKDAAQNMKKVALAARK